MSGAGHGDGVPTAPAVGGSARLRAPLCCSLEPTYWASLPTRAGRGREGLRPSGSPTPSTRLWEWVQDPWVRALKDTSGAAAHTLLDVPGARHGPAVGCGGAACGPSPAPGPAGRPLPPTPCSRQGWWGTLPWRTLGQEKRQKPLQTPAPGVCVAGRWLPTQARHS